MDRERADHAAMGMAEMWNVGVTLESSDSSVYSEWVDCSESVRGIFTGN